MNQSYHNQKPVECGNPACREHNNTNTRWKFHFINSQGNVTLETTLCCICQEEEFAKASQNLHERILELERKYEILLNINLV